MNLLSHIMPVISEIHTRTCRGKLIYKHEDHALWIESLVFGNPIGQWYKDNVRPLNGAAMGILGRIIWMLINWWCDDQVCLTCMTTLYLLASAKVQEGIRPTADHALMPNSYTKF